MFETEWTNVLAENRLLNILASLGFKQKRRCFVWSSIRMEETIYYSVNDSHADIFTNIIFKIQSGEYTQERVSRQSYALYKWIVFNFWAQSPPGILITDKLLLNLRESKNDNVKYDKNTPKMIINNPEGTGMVKDEEDEHGLQLSHELENFGLNFSR